MWSDVEILTNEDTNTVRLDSVSKEENGSGLYQVDTLVKISSANEVRNVSIYIIGGKKYINFTLMSKGVFKTYIRENTFSNRRFSGALMSLNAVYGLINDRTDVCFGHLSLAGTSRSPALILLWI